MAFQYLSLFERIKHIMYSRKINRGWYWWVWKSGT